MKHTIEELDNGQLDLMWNFLRFGCGQKSNIPALKEHLDMLRQAMSQKTGGQEKYKDSQSVDFNDIGTIINCIVIESMQLYLSGDLDRLEKLKASVQPEDKMGHWFDVGSKIAKKVITALNAERT